MATRGYRDGTQGGIPTVVYIPREPVYTVIHHGRPVYTVIHHGRPEYRIYTPWEARVPYIHTQGG